MEFFYGKCAREHNKNDKYPRVGLNIIHTTHKGAFRNLTRLAGRAGVRCVNESGNLRRPERINNAVIEFFFSFLFFIIPFNFFIFPLIFPVFRRPSPPPPLLNHVARNRARRRKITLSRSASDRPPHTPRLLNSNNNNNDPNGTVITVIITTRARTPYTYTSW